MKKITVLLVTNLFVFAIWAQQELHIHHINIENGDATLIGIFDIAQQKYTSKVLIDGGQSAAEVTLLPYIKNMIGDDEESFHFEYIILSHYHNDHYNGLLAIQTGELTADSIIDPGGYKVSSYFNHSAIKGIRPDSLKIALAWLDAIKIASDHTPNPFVRGRSKIMIRFSTNNNTSLGNKITIGVIGTQLVELECIAGWGNTLSSGGEIERNPGPKKSNGNNFSLAFILSCGEFRYFIGGDLGGKNTGEYIDQETSVTTYFDEKYPKSFSWTGNEFLKGHVCGFKANHHGSNYSNTSGFMEGMHPSIIVTSAGNNKSWHLPHPQYLQRLSLIQPLSFSSDSTFTKGVYFTNLYNFTNFPSETTANNLFQNQVGVSYDFGNNSSTAKGSYLIKVKDEDTLDQRSIFEVGRVDLNEIIPYKKLAVFFCHSK